MQSIRFRVGTRKWKTHTTKVHVPHGRYKAERLKYRKDKRMMVFLNRKTGRMSELIVNLKLLAGIIERSN